jgi:class 3 adenylate cyclase
MSVPPTRTASSTALAALRPTPGGTAADSDAFAAHEREVLVRRWRIFAPLTFVLFALSEVAAHLSREFPKAPIITACMLALMAGMYLLARSNPSRRTIGWATAFTGTCAAAYIGTACAETGRFGSLQVMAMAVLISMVPGILSLRLPESLATLGGSVTAWALVTRFWKPDLPVSTVGLATGLTYVLFLAAVTALAVNANRRLRYREFLARRDVERIHRFAVEEVLHRHLPPRYVTRVLSGEHPLDSPPERRLVTVIFADIVSFTPLSDALKPEELAELMARFYDATASIAFDHGATIDKFIGDAVMAILGAPEPMSPEDQAQHAVDVARGWHRAVAALPRRDGDTRPLQLRIGIHQDHVAVGSFGGRLRSDYTVLGRGVNIAARLEQRCRPGEIMVSGDVWKWLDPGGFQSRELGEVELKGIPSPVRCVCIIPDGVTPEPRVP